MAHTSTPHFHNTEGLKRIEVGSKEFMCVGALPPFDHPHIYIDMGKDTEVVCSYCSTLYVFNPSARARHVAAAVGRLSRRTRLARPMASSGRTIYIAGAGIAGHDAGVGARQVRRDRGRRRAQKKVQEVGAGLQISPNARRVLNQLGLDKAIAAEELRARRHRRPSVPRRASRW